MASKEIQLIISARDETMKAFNSVKGSLEGVGINFDKMAKQGAIAFGAITGAVGLSIKAFADSEAQLTRTDQAIRNIDLSKMGTDFDTASKKARDFGSKLQSVAGIADEAGAESFAKLLAITNDYDEATKLATLSADLSVAKQVDMTTSTKMISLALQGNVKLLKEYGIELEDGATKQEVIGAIMDKVSGQAEAYGKTVAGQTDIMKESFGDMQESIGQAFAPIFGKIIETLLPIIQKFKEWAEENPKLLTTIVLVVGGLAGLIAIIGTIGMVIPAIITGVGVLGAVFAFLVSPIGLVILAIGALIAVGVLIYKNWETIKAKAVEIWTAISNFFTEIFTSIGNFFKTIWNGIVAFFTQVWEIIKTIFSFAVAFIAGLVILIFQAMGIDIIKVFEDIKNGLQSAWDWIKNAFQVSLDFIKNLWNTIWEAVSSFFTSKWENIKNYFSSVLNWIKSVLNAFVKPFKDLWNALWDAIGGSVQRAFDGVVNIIKGALNWVIDKINAVISAANSVAQIGSKIGIKPPTIPELPRLANGGIVNRPTIAMIGEAGPEAVIPLSKNKGFGNIIINITGNTIQTADDITELVNEGLNRALRLNNQLSY